MIALDVAARLTSDSLMAPTPPWITLTITSSLESLVRLCLTASTDPCTSALTMIGSSLRSVSYTHLDVYKRQPVRSMIVLIVFPLCPTTSPIFCGSIWIWMIFGANSPTVVRGLSIHFSITSVRIYSLASFVLRIASSTDVYKRQAPHPRQVSVHLPCH